MARAMVPRNIRTNLRPIMVPNVIGWETSPKPCGGNRQYLIAARPPIVCSSLDRLNPIRRKPSPRFYGYHLLVYLRTQARGDSRPRPLEPDCRIPSAHLGWQVKFITLGTPLT